MDAFDADVLIYAATGEPLGDGVRALFPEDLERGPTDTVGIGSVALIPETLPKPRRNGADRELVALRAMLTRLDLRPVDESIADLANDVATAYGLRAIDAIHLATATFARADRFITNNRRDFPKSIAEIEIVYPDELPAPRRR